MNCINSALVSDALCIKWQVQLWLNKRTSPISHPIFPAKMKWKIPLYIGIPPARRYGHTAFIFHSHVCKELNLTLSSSSLVYHSYPCVCVCWWQLFVFGGKNEEQEFNDLKVMKLINPSERQPGTRWLHSIRGVCSALSCLHWLQHIWWTSVSISWNLDKLILKRSVANADTDTWGDIERLL